MKMLMLIFIVLLIIFYLYEEHRKRIRVPIIIVLAIITISLISTSFKCAVNVAPNALKTFSWKTVKLQHGLCVLSNDLRRMRAGM